jgi:hypothetical protein
MLDAAAYRVKAREMRERAGSTHDPVAYQELMSLAARYEVLARQIELSSATRLNDACCGRSGP